MTHQTIMAYTLVDISKNDAIHVRDANTQQYHQMQNLNVLLQTIGLKTQPMNIAVRQLIQADLSKFEFYDFGVDTANVWVLKFDIEHDSIWQIDDNPLAGLYNDIDQVAISGDLTNSIDFGINIFDVTNKRNIYFKIHNF